MKDRLLLMLFGLIGRLPLGVSRVLGTLMGYLVWIGQGRAVRITRRNIQLCFPELNPDEQKQLVRESLLETARTAAEAPAIWRNSWDWLRQRILAVEGEELLRQRLAQGKGLLVLAPHHGNWEVVAPYLASVAPLTAMYQPLKSAALDQLVLSGRSKLDITMAPTNRRGVMMLFKTLQQGKIVGILPDQVPDKDAAGGVAPFFGQPALTVGLIHGLIQKTGCGLVSVVALRVPGGFKVQVLDVDERIHSEDQTQSLTGLNASVEACVRLAPAQYQWEYKRFRRLPEPHVNPYVTGSSKRRPGK
jgi:KDO2-lipid IV(A) lauroyltransferase